MPSLIEIEGVGSSLAAACVKKNYRTIAKIAAATPKELATVTGVSEKSAPLIIASAKSLLPDPRIQKSTTMKKRRTVPPVKVAPKATAAKPKTKAKPKPKPKAKAKAVVKAKVKPALKTAKKPSVKPATKEEKMSASNAKDKIKKLKKKISKLKDKKKKIVKKENKKVKAKKAKKSVKKPSKKK